MLYFPLNLRYIVRLSQRCNEILIYVLLPEVIQVRPPLLKVNFWRFLQTACASVHQIASKRGKKCKNIHKEIY